MKKNLQPSFFAQTQEDLPLFSGTVPKAKIKPFTPKPKPHQAAIKVTCNACMDTGKLGDNKCWCQSDGVNAGTPNIYPPIVYECAALSSGTIANLSGYAEYSNISLIQNDLVGWVKFYEWKEFKNWQEAWDDFWPNHKLHPSVANKKVPKYVIRWLNAAFHGTKSTFYPGYFVVWNDQTNDKLVELFLPSPGDEPFTLNDGAFKIRFDWGIGRYLVSV